MKYSKDYPFQIVSIILVIHCEEKYLLVQRNHKDKIFPGKWQNPGGKVELGETIEKAIKRESKEEININIQDQPIFLQSYAWEKSKEDPMRLGIIFLVNLPKRICNYKVKLNSELADYNWFTIEEAKRLNFENRLIGKESPTGTLGQLLKAEAIK